jgi:hypothetical protein
MALLRFSEAWRFTGLSAKLAGVGLEETPDPVTWGDETRTGRIVGRRGETTGKLFVGRADRVVVECFLKAGRYVELWNDFPDLVETGLPRLEGYAPRMVEDGDLAE